MRSGSWHCWSGALDGRATVEQEWESAPEPGKQLRGIAFARRLVLYYPIRIDQDRRTLYV